jgi:hypothetical protein
MGGRLLPISQKIAVVVTLVRPHSAKCESHIILGYSNLIIALPNLMASKLFLVLFRWIFHWAVSDPTVLRIASVLVPLRILKVSKAFEFRAFRSAFYLSVTLEVRNRAKIATFEVIFATY